MIWDGRATLPPRPPPSVCSDSEIIRWSGYLDPAHTGEAGKLKEFADKLAATGGGAWRR